MNELSGSSAAAAAPIVVFGATSDVATALLRTYAGEGRALVLVGRNEAALSALAADLRVRGATSIEAILQDSLQFSDHRRLIESLFASVRPEKFYFFQGSLPDQSACEADFETARQAIEINFTALSSYLTWLANALERSLAAGEAASSNTGATIVVVSSVAGDRGRGSNYVYGAAKGALTIFLQGLRNRLFKAGFGVLTVKPGFIDTKMTADIDKGGPLWATPQKVASDIRKAADNGRSVIYTPFFWRFIMIIIKSIPETVFRRLSL